MPAGILTRVFLVAVVTAVALGTADAQDCSSVAGQNRFVRDVLNEYYLWYREIPSTDPALFDSPEAYLEAVRYRPIDRSYSYIAPLASTQAFYSNSQFVGIGFSQIQLGPAELRVAQVFPDSPAEDVGLRRGDYLVAINGRPIGELIASGELDAELGPATIGYSLELTWRTRAGERFTARVTKRPVTIPTVSQTAVIDNGGLPVGYIHFRNFVEPSIPALNQAFNELRRRGVVDLVLDLRYNGGGLVDVAQHLGSLIGGMRTNTRIFVEYLHNDRQTARNKQVRFEDPAAALDVPRLVVITSRASASSSELVINGLDPFIPVTLVGRRSFGKPVGQYGFEFCEKMFFPVSFRGVNARGDGDYYSGFPVDCPMRDGLDRPLGHPEEARLAEALYYLRRGSCSAASAQAFEAQRIAPDFAPIELGGFDQIVNAW